MTPKKPFLAKFAREPRNIETGLPDDNPDNHTTEPSAPQVSPRPTILTSVNAETTDDR